MPHLDLSTEGPSPRTPPRPRRRRNREERDERRTAPADQTDRPTDPVWLAKCHHHPSETARGSVIVDSHYNDRSVKLLSRAEGQFSKLLKPTSRRGSWMLISDILPIQVRLVNDEGAVHISTTLYPPSSGSWVHEAGREEEEDGYSMGNTK